MHAELHVIYLYAQTYCLMQFTVVNQLQPDMARRQRKYVNNSVKVHASPVRSRVI